MKSILQLDLHSDARTDTTPASSVQAPSADNPAAAGVEEPKGFVPSKRLTRMANRAAHKSSSRFSGGGIFSK